MEAITLSTDLHCNSCVSKISPLLKDDPSIQHYDIDLDHPEKLVTIQGNSLNTEELISKFEHAGYHARLYNEIKPIQIQEIKPALTAFWRNPINYRLEPIEWNTESAGIIPLAGGY